MTTEAKKRHPPMNLVEIRSLLAKYLTQPPVRLLAKTSVTPNIITWFGLLLSIGAGVLVVNGHLVWAGLVVLIAGLFDIVDGALARQTKQITSFGGILDSTLDRIGESVVLLGILAFYAGNSIIGVLLAGVALPSSLLVSYIRARAEVAGIECKVGIFTRAERVIILALGLLLSQINYALVIALAIIIFFSLFTVVQRLMHVWQETGKSQRSS